MSILAHPEWPRIRPFIRIDYYGRDTSRHKTRFRIELKNVPKGDAPWLLAVRIPCVACEKIIQPIRGRNGKATHLYYGCSCSPPHQRGRAARDEYNAVEAHIKTWRSYERSVAG